jgi:hypothetical protein
MTTYTYTDHALTRRQQRAIPPLIIKWLLEYGATQHDHRGGVVHYFDKHARKALAHDAGQLIVDHLKGFLDAYLVAIDNCIITVGYRYKRLNRS